ncbi:hypothetical protein EV127DRAFT_200747 [Xylaria flabelliformis]|nr:hypothetical protein EV127DRAFT_200747 [Xylaria flabelliformis]
MQVSFYTLGPSASFPVSLYTSPSATVRRSSRELLQDPSVTIMAGPASPNEGPTFEPPHLPPGWIAQWDGSSKKYYYVQLSTGVSQWEVPTDAAPGGTPAQSNEHPYGVPGPREVITHPDGTQTLKHPDGRMEPILPPESSRSLDGSISDRGFGSIATNALLGQFTSGNGKPHSGGSQGSGGLGNLAGQLIGSLSNSHGGSSGSHSGGGGSGNLVGQLASNLFSSGHKPDQPQNYHGGQSHSSSGLAGQVMGGVSGIFGGHHGKQSGQNFGYSNSGQAGSYSGQAPPTSYQSPNASTPSYSSPPSNQHSAPSYNPPPGQHGTPSFPPPPGQHGAPSYGQGGPHTPYGSSGPPSNYGHSPASHEYRESLGTRLNHFQLPSFSNVSSSSTKPIHIFSGSAVIRGSPTTISTSSFGVQSAIPAPSFGGCSTSVPWSTFLHQSRVCSAAWSTRQSTRIPPSWKLVIEFSKSDWSAPGQAPSAVPRISCPFTSRVFMLKWPCVRRKGD